MLGFIIFRIMLLVLSIFIAKEQINVYNYNKFSKNTLIGKSYKDVWPYYLLWLLILLLSLISVGFFLPRNSIKISDEDGVVVKYFSGHEITTGIYKDNTGYIYYYFDLSGKLQIDGLSGEDIVSLYNEYFNKEFLKKYIDNLDVDYSSTNSGIYLGDIENTNLLSLESGLYYNVNDNLLNQNGKKIIDDNDIRCSNDKHWEYNGCVNNVKDAYIKDGYGIWIWNGVNREGPMIKYCDEEFVPKGNGYGWECVKYEDDSIDVSTNIGDIGNLISKLDLPDDCEWGYVDRVVDGDTIVIDNNKIRLIGIDTPETVDPNKPVEFYGEEASEKMKDLVLNKKVCLAGDYKLPDIDMYGRYLKYVYLGNAIFVNEEMLKGGYAKAYLDSNYFHKDYFINLENEAHKSKIGMWQQLY